jgi:hypothetical protein
MQQAQTQLRVTSQSCAYDRDEDKAQAAQRAEDDRAKFRAAQDDIMDLKAQVGLVLCNIGSSNIVQSS